MCYKKIDMDKAPIPLRDVGHLLHPNGDEALWQMTWVYSRDVIKPLNNQSIGMAFPIYIA